MKDQLIKRISNLLSIKSLMTLSMTIGFLYLTLTGVIGAELFMSVFGIVVGFYFSSQSNKNK